MLARVHEGDRHGHDVGNEQRPDPPAGAGPEEQQQEQRVRGVQRRHRRYVVVEGAAACEQGRRRVYPEMLPDDRNDPVYGPGVAVPASHPRRHGRIKHVSHVADEGEGDEQGDVAPEPLVVTLPEHGGDHVAHKEVAGVHGPRRVVPHVEMAGIEEPGLQPEGGHLAEADEAVERHLGPDEGAPQRMAGVPAQQAVDNQHGVEREPVTEHPATPAAQVVKAGHEEGSGQPDQHRVLGLRKTQGHRGHGEGHDQDCPPGKRPVPTHHPGPHPRGARRSLAEIIAGPSADPVSSRCCVHRRPARRPSL